MKRLKISNAEVQSLLAKKTFSYPKYAMQLITLANANAQITRARIVGQMGELIRQFEGKTLDEWSYWYTGQHPDSTGKATDKVFAMMEAMQRTIVEVDRDLVRRWAEEMAIIKTFAGLKFQEAILKKLAEVTQTDYKVATKVEESVGIDGHVGDVAVSIKPHTYKAKILSGKIEVAMVFHAKTKDGILIEYDF
ncbi:MAG: MjaI family restriction endonuclease [Cytophagaceae bacterium]|nr:MjaI family restriction endonuclease [Cytophagaceae bacterium]